MFWSIVAIGAISLNIIGSVLRIAMFSDASSLEAVFVILSL